jgi:hypothetical protein
MHPVIETTAHFFRDAREAGGRQGRNTPLRRRKKRNDLKNESFAQKCPKVKNFRPPNASRRKSMAAGFLVPLDCNPNIPARSADIPHLPAVGA